MLLPILDVSRITQTQLKHKFDPSSMQAKQEERVESRMQLTPLMRLMSDPLFDRNLMLIVFGYLCDVNDESCVIDYELSESD